MEKVKDREYQDIIYHIDQEATAAERLAWKKRDVSSGDDQRLERYVRFLKDFVLFMRHGVKTTSTRKFDLNAFDIKRDTSRYRVN